MQNRKKGKRKCKFFYALPQYFQKNILNFSYALFTNFLLPFFSAHFPPAGALHFSTSCDSVRIGLFLQCQKGRIPCPQQL